MKNVYLIEARSFKNYNQKAKFIDDCYSSLKKAKQRIADMKTLYGDAVTLVSDSEAHYDGEGHGSFVAYQIVQVSVK
jgi:hypothetical protein